jgi:hypothetical protein
MQSRPWATGMEPGLHQLEAITVASEIDEHPENEEALDKLLAKYPKDPGVPYAAAKVLEEHGMPEYELKFYEMALERGGYPGDAHIREICEQTFTDFPPSAAWSATALRIERKWYAHDRVLWAEKHLDQGAANEFLNAWEILHEEKRPEPEERFRRDLHDFLLGGKAAAVKARILAEHDPAARDRVRELVQSGLGNDTFDIGVREEMQAFLAAYR